MKNWNLVMVAALIGLSVQANAFWWNRESKAPEKTTAQIYEETAESYRQTADTYRRIGELYREMRDDLDRLSDRMKRDQVHSSLVELRYCASDVSATWNAGKIEREMDVAEALMSFCSGLLASLQRQENGMNQIDADGLLSALRAGEARYRNSLSVHALLIKYESAEIQNPEETLEFLRSITRAGGY